MWKDTKKAAPKDGFSYVDERVDYSATISVILNAWLLAFLDKSYEAVAI